MADNLIEAAREFVEPAKNGLLLLMADFAAQRIAARESEIAARLQEIHAIGPCAILNSGAHCFVCSYIEELQEGGGRERRNE